MTIDGYLSATVQKHDTGQSKTISRFKHNVLVNSGRDQMHTNVYTGTTLSGSGFNFVALTQDTTQTINASATTLTGEIATSGLTRAQASTRTHTSGTNSTTIEHTFTASGSFTDVVRSALFNASSSGTMSHFAPFSTGTGALVTNDTLKVTWTLNLG